MSSLGRLQQQGKYRGVTLTPEQQCESINAAVWDAMLRVFALALHAECPPLNFGSSTLFDMPDHRSQPMVGILLEPPAVVDRRQVHVNRSPARRWCLADIALGARALDAFPLDAFYFVLEGWPSMPSLRCFDLHVALYPRTRSLIRTTRLYRATSVSDLDRPEWPVLWSRLRPNSHTSIPVSGVSDWGYGSGKCYLHQ